MSARLACALLFHVAAALALVAGAARAEAQPPGAAASAPRTFVLVHGAWGGGWAWKRVDSLLSARGHTVYRATLTGLGERVHLATAAVDLETHIADVVNLLRFEELRDVVLVGHSYGGMVVTGVADRAPDRLSRLVYVDAMLPDSGESVLTTRMRGGGLPVERWERDGLIVPPWIGEAPTVPGDVPHPMRSFTQPLVLTGAAGRRVPGTYILTVERGATEDAFSEFAERASRRGWPVVRMEGGHNPQTTDPEGIARLLDAAR